LAVLCAFAQAPALAARYDDYDAWLAEASARGAVRHLSLTPVREVPQAGATYVDDEMTLIFPDNHGGMSVTANGWHGDVHGGPDDPTDHEPHENRFVFSTPIIAFSARVWVNGSVSHESDSIFIETGGQRYFLTWTDYHDFDPAPKKIFGFVLDQPTATLRVSSNTGWQGHAIFDVQYVSVPEPSAALACLTALWPLTRWSRRGHLRPGNRHAIRHPIPPGRPGCLGRRLG
jgi:hypothetical protein